MREYLGVSIQYPFKLINGKPSLVAGVDNIKQSIEHILATPKGHRYMLPEYGSRIEEMIFEQNDDVLKSMLRLFIKEALDTWETRIKFRDVSFDQDNTLISCNIVYNIINQNEIGSYVFPFYRRLNY